jgi:hypothetical protein
LHLSTAPPEVPMWEITPREHAGPPRRLDGIPPTMEVPLKFETRRKQTGGARRLR